MVVSWFLGTVQAFAHDEGYLLTRIEHASLEKKNIETITQDKTGFLWMGSGNGLLRFDGRSVRIYTHIVGPQRSLPISRVRSVLTDEHGRIWATTQGGGLSLYLPETDEFQNFIPSEDTSAAHNVNNYDFWSIEQSRDGHLWVSSYGGDVFYRFNTVTMSFDRFPVEPTANSSYIATLATLQLRNRDIWVGTDDDGIIVFGPDGRERTRYRHEVGNSRSLRGNSVRKMIEGPDGRIWIGLYGGGLNWYNPRTGAFGRPTAIYGADPNKFGNVYALIFDSMGHLWVGTDDGLLVFDTETNRILHHFVHEPANPRSLVNNRIRSLYQDRNGIIWAGNEHGGLHKLIRSTVFTHVGIDSESPNSLSAPTVRSFLQVDEQTLWVGTQGGGINVLHRDGYRVVGTITHDPRNPQSLSNNGVTTFLKDTDGYIWVGTWGGGLNRYDPVARTFRRYTFRENDPSSISDNRIQLLHIDSKGRFWVGTENGLNIMDRESGQFERIFHDPDDTESLYGKSVQTLGFSEDTHDVYWVGTWHGLFRLDLQSRSFTRFSNILGDSGSLSSDHVLSIYDDRAGSLWLGSFGVGLVRFDKTTYQSEVFLDNDGAPSNVVFSVMSDDAGYLWLSTNNGLSRFDPKSRFFRNFNEEDGLRNVEFWWGAAYKTTQGDILYGSTFGFTVFNPQNIVENSYVPQLAISSLYVFDERRVVPPSGTLTLSYQENYLTIEFASLDFTNPRRNQYAYMLEGLDKDWIYSGNRNVVSYSSLSGGHYTFRVIGTNSDGVWNETGVRLHIFIDPPFWQKTWFYFLMVFVAIGFVYGVAMLRTRQVTQTNRRLELLVSERTRDLAAKQEEVLRRNLELQEQAQLLRDQKQEIEAQLEMLLANSRELESANDELRRINQEKNNLIGIVAHDLRSPLATVISALQVLRMNPNMPAEEVETLYESMEQYIKGQLTMISKILDIEAVESGKITLHPQQIMIQDALGRVVSQFKAEMARKHISILQQIPTEPIFVMADMNYLMQVLDNLYSNALKFSPIGGTIEIGCQIRGANVRIYFRDEGPGLTAEDHKKLFGKFQKLSARPTGGEKSTGLGLSIVKRFTEAMDGRVWCESEPGKGATFLVDFPRITTL